MKSQKAASADAPPAASDHLAFPVVGIGASAGGFTALTTLLQNMPASPGLALVIVLHLPADKPSKADKILQGNSSLPVVQVSYTMRILPDQIYVVPPNRILLMHDGHLVLDERCRTPGDPTTIDVFFRTLAIAHKENAIGVVLSGMGADGTAGLACIKEQGGVTITQLPADAEQGSMPQSAIDNGMADFVLTAAQIPAKLIELSGISRTIRERARYGKSPAEVRFDMGPDPQQTLHDLLSLLHARTGHDFRQYRQPTLLRRLERRLQVRSLPDLPSYRELLRQDDSEAHALLKDLLIGVTRFFRDQDAFAALEHMVLPQIFRDKRAGDTLRVWVSACSTGEEAYSIAMLLADQAAALAEPPGIQVFASDIDAQAIHIARTGLYPASIAEDVTAERLQRYFTTENGAYKVRKALRDQVLFAEQNLLRDPAFSRLDLVTCRNFLIYLNREMHRHVLSMFHFALLPGGYIMLGNAETAEEASSLFAPVNSAQRLYQAKADSSAASSPAALSPPPVRHAAPVGRVEASATARRSRLYSFAEIHLQKAAEQAPPTILVNNNFEIVHISEQASHFLRHAGGEPTRDLATLVAPELRLQLRTALFQAQKCDLRVSTGPVHYQQDGEHRAIDMTVFPFQDEHAEGLLMLVSFKEIVQAPPAAFPTAPVERRDQSLHEQLDEELRQTRLRLQETIDQTEQSSAVLRTTIEELQTSVAQLRLANEELETGMAEVRSINEEVKAVNAELRRRLEILTKDHDDLNNLIASSDVATLFLNRDMRIVRYTPRTADLFNLIPGDIGRPLQHLASRLDNPCLAEDSQRVFETLKPLEQEVHSNDGRDYIVRVHPYRSSEHRIGGAVMTFFDITERRRAEKALREREERHAFLLKFSDALRARRDEQSIKEHGVKSVAEHLRLDRCWISEVFEDKGISTVGPEQIRADLPPMTGIYQLSEYPETMRQLATQPMVIQNVADDARFSEAEKTLLAGLRLDSLLVTPLRKGNSHVIWALAASMAAPRQWTDNDRLLIEEVAERIWAAVERTRTESSLRDSEMRYRTLFDKMGEGFAVYSVIRDERGKVCDITYEELNGALERQTGYDRRTLLGRRMSERFPPPVAKKWLEHYAQAADSGEPVKVVDYVATLDKWFDVSIYPQSGDRLSIFYRDVTDRQRAEESLRERERKQSFLLKFSDTLREELDADAVAYRAVRMLSNEMQLDRCYITFYRPDEDEAVFPYQVGNDTVPPLPPKVRLSDFPEAYTQVLERTFVVEDDFERRGLAPAERANSKALGMQAMVASTVRKGERNPICSMAAVSSRPRCWTPDEIALVEDAAERTWAAMERALAESALRESETKYRTLYANVAPSDAADRVASGDPDAP